MELGFAYQAHLPKVLGTVLWINLGKRVLFIDAGIAAESGTELTLRDVLHFYFGFWLAADPTCILRHVF